MTSEYDLNPSRSKEIQIDKSSESPHENLSEKDSTNVRQRTTFKEVDERNKSITENPLSTTHETYSPTPKRNVLIGFLRVGNWIGGLWGLTISVLFLVSSSSVSKTKDSESQLDFLTHFSNTLLTSLFLSFNSLALLSDALASFSFRWKEYGEISSESNESCFEAHRGLTRLCLSLLIVSSSSCLTLFNLTPSFDFEFFDFVISTDLPLQIPLALSYIPLISSSLSLVFSLFIYSPWLFNHESRRLSSSVKSRTGLGEKYTRVLSSLFSLISLSLLIFLLQGDFITFDESATQEIRDSILLHSLLPLLLVSIASLFSQLYFWRFQIHKIPLSCLSIVFSCLTLSFKALLFTKIYFYNLIQGIWLLVAVLVLSCLLIQTIEVFISIKPWEKHNTCHWGQNDGKEVKYPLFRICTSIGFLLGLFGLFLGLGALLMNQMDLEFVLSGRIAELINQSSRFEEEFRPVKNKLKDIIRALDKKFDCSQLYQALGAGTAASLLSSFFPGASSLVSVGSRSAYYGVRISNSLSNLALKLKRSLSYMWKTLSIIRKLSSLTAKGLRGVLVTHNLALLSKILPLLPPLCLGLHLLFPAFWPNKIIFFSTGQRNKTLLSFFFTYLSYFLLFVFLLLLQNLFASQIISLLNQNLPLLDVILIPRLGHWISCAANICSLFSSLFLSFSFLYLFLVTKASSENCTNEEKSWNFELEKRQLLVTSTARGDLIEKETRILYKRERIGAWNWTLPFCIAILGNGVGFLGTENSKLEVNLESKGSFGRLLEKILGNFDSYDDYMSSLSYESSLECLPFPTFNDALSRNQSLLHVSIHQFMNETNGLISPYKKLLKTVYSQLTNSLEEKIFENDVRTLWKKISFSTSFMIYVFLIPRILCCLIIVFGFFASFIFTCSNRIFEAIEPRRIVEAYGTVCKFSICVGIGSLLLFSSLLSGLGLPFFHVSVRLGSGFLLDLIADGLLMSVYIGMKNEFFFAIPKKQSIVTYSVPGVSQGGPSKSGQII